MRRRQAKRILTRWAKGTSYRRRTMDRVRHHGGVELAFDFGDWGNPARRASVRAKWRPVLPEEGVSYFEIALGQEVTP